MIKTLLESKEHRASVKDIARRHVEKRRPAGYANSKLTGSIIA